jgi:hypothetical protein
MQRWEHVSVPASQSPYGPKRLWSCLSRWTLAALRFIPRVWSAITAAFALFKSQGCWRTTREPNEHSSSSNCFRSGTPTASVLVVVCTRLPADRRWDRPECLPLPMASQGISSLASDRVWRRVRRLLRAMPVRALHQPLIRPELHSTSISIHET